ncbi:glycerol-3-phosphate acyltransferase [Paenisporosarcina indica]|uniref:glycerol-3-phosphate acyltransferase n=1 Tax=Paenisporosarcina indica TaxID=650093 RepID=UPI00094F7B3D|nr:glycerol-3-phosphate acyltransferase [Paenisporosarcina indica]
MNLWLWILLIVLCGYFLGSLHGSKMAQLLSGVNVKEQGVKNSGASNATMVLGWKYGALVALIDIGKGILGVLILSYFLQSTSFSNEQIVSLLFLTGAAVVTGHNFPVWMNFDGGKGTASVIGLLFAIDLKLGLIGLSVFVITSLLTDFILLGVLGLYVVLCGYAIWFTDGYWSSAIAIGLFLIAIWKHQDNVKRFRAHAEPRLSSVIKKKKTASPSK